jgi:tRNA (cmo5U34)-methyltransferase
MTTRHFDDRRARVYDALIRQVVPGYDVLHRLAAVHLRETLPEAARILVAGAGTGAEIAALAPVSPGWRFTGFDPAAEMLAAARQRVDALGAAGRVELVAGGVEAVAAADFDAATLLLVLHFLPDDGAKQALLDGLGARLKPGAPLVLADLHGRPGEASFQRLMALWRAWQLDAGIPPEEVEKGFRKIVADIHFVPEDRLAELLGHAGFGRPEKFWGALLFGGWVARRRRA